MSAAAQEWLNLVLRWAHVIAAILWIGDSFLFMWLDSHLEPSTRNREGEVVGELWMTHSGGFYEVVKRKSLMKSELPANLHWFKWESYTTWMSGFLLLVVVYHLNARALLLDPGVSLLQPWEAVAISLMSLPLAYGLYELLWKTPLASHSRMFAAVGFGLLVAAAFAYSRLFSGRGAFLQMGAVMGSIMAANVFFRIIPAQKHMLAATRAGTPVDTSHGVRAKGRSIQNHYLTLPVLFTMLSNHFPTTYGSSWAWLTLACLMAFGVGLKYVMNFRRKASPALVTATVAAFLGAAVLSWPTSPLAAARATYEGKPKVAFATVNGIIQTRCTVCHSAHPVSALFAAPPQGVALDTPEALKAHGERVFLRAVVTQTMPLGNITAMTVDERAVLGAWYAQGMDVLGSAHVGPQQAAALPVAQATLASAPDGPASILVPDFEITTTASFVENGKAAFGVKGCTTCHRVGGGNFVGPDLKNVTARRSATWLKRMILHPERMVVEDAVARQLYLDRRTAMPNQHVDPETELRFILAYLKSEETK